MSESERQASREGEGGAVLDLRELSFAYPGGPTVLEDVTLVARRGRVHVVLGPNGAGKSTLLALCLGQLRPGRGEVWLDGAPVARLDARSRAARLAFVPQRSRIDFPFTAREVISMGRFHARGDAAELVDRAIARTGLEALASRPFEALSVGEAQRVLFARALAQLDSADAAAVGPRAMLLDEPVSAMDLRHAHETMETLRSLARDEGVAVVVVLQDLNLAGRHADEIWLLASGRVCECGPPARVLREDLLAQVYGLPLRRVSAEDLQERPRFEA